LRTRMVEVAALRDYQDSVLRSAANAIVTLDTSGRVTVFNRAAETIFGVPSSFAVGRPYDEVLGPAVSVRLLSRFGRVMGKGERIADLEFDGPLNGRDRAVLRLSLSPLGSLGDRGPQGLVLIADDLTEARLAA